MRNFWFFFVTILFGSEFLFSEQSLCDRVYDHLLIRDADSAVEAAREALVRDSDSPHVWEAAIAALAAKGEEKEMHQTWKAFIGRFPDQADNRQVLEAMAWGVIQKGACSSTPVMRLLSTLAAFYGQDAKGVSILQGSLRDQNPQVRAAALELVSGMRDHTLCKEVKGIFYHDRDWHVRMEAIRSAGKMQIKSLEGDLIAILFNRRSLAEEKAAASEALVNMTDEVETARIAAFAHSDRAGLKLLACQLAAHFDCKEDWRLIAELIKDHSPEVRACALRTLAILKEGSSSDVLGSIQDRDPRVVISAAWWLTLRDHPEGLSAFRSLLKHPRSDARRAAAAALAATGDHGSMLMKEGFQGSEDPFVKMNLALGLIANGLERERMSVYLAERIAQDSQKWMWDEHDYWRVLLPGNLALHPVIPRYPEAVNQVTRLEILNTLCVIRSSVSCLAIHRFLRQSTWGVSGMASAILLTEGDDEAVRQVEALLEADEHRVRVQAALIVALWGKGESALSVLEKMYPISDRETRERILEGIGRVGSFSSTRFLAEKLSEPYQTLRIIAAASLLQCLYN